MKQTMTVGKIWKIAAASMVLFAAALVGCSPPTSPPDVANAERPNIIIVLADDLGYGDVGTFGSEIETPHLDRLAAGGLYLSNFHVGAACSPTRTMLMTGVDNHLAGLGNMLEIIADNQYGKPGYEGHLNESVVTLPTLLRDGGYHTYMVGKWHLGKDARNIPHARGFDRSFALMESGADNWVNQPYGPMYRKVHYYEDDQEVDLPTENYFSTDHYTDKLIEYIESNKESGKPFFGYLAYQAVHLPHQAPREFIDKYDGVYDEGWVETRRARFERQKQKGLVPEGAALTLDYGKSTMYSVGDWDALGDEDKAFSARTMQAYAGMVDNMDHNIGRLMEYLESINEADNTLIIFTSDNGSDPTELELMQAFGPWYDKNYRYVTREDYSPGYPEMGQKGSYVSKGAGWAAAASAPTSYWKTYSTEGGLRVPFIAHYPGKIPAGKASSAFGYVKDLVPTVLEIAGIERPGDSYNGRTIHPPSGVSLWRLMKGEAASVHAPDAAVGYELAGSSAVFRGNFKLVRNLPPKGTGEWELYDTVADPSEARDLAGEQPDLVAELIQAYEEYERENNVIPVPDDYDPSVQIQKNAARRAAH